MKYMKPDDIKIKPYPPEIIKLNTDQGYIQWFYHLLKEAPSNKAAWLELEVMHEKYFGKERFTNYKSFQNFRNTFFRGQSYAKKA